MDFERVMSGIIRYIERKIYPGLTAWQELLAGTVVDQFYEGRDELKKTILDNHAYKMVIGMDSNGNIDIDGLATKIKRRIEKKGKIEIKLPLMPKLTFSPEDVDELLAVVKE